MLLSSTCVCKTVNPLPNEQQRKVKDGEGGGETEEMPRDKLEAG